MTFFARLPFAALLATLAIGWAAAAARAEWPSGAFVPRTFSDVRYVGRYLREVSDGAGGAWAFMVGVDPTTRTGDGVTAHLGANGDVLSPLRGGVYFNDLTGEIKPLEIHLDGQGGALLLYQRDPYYYPPDTAYVQRVGPDGATLWGTRGVKIPSATYVPTHIHAIPDGSGGAFVCWVEGFYGRLVHVLPAGVLDPAWPANGVELAGRTTTVDLAQLESDGRGGVLAVFIAYGIAGPYSDVFVRHILADGTSAPGWSATGLELIGALTPAGLSTMADGSGGVFVSSFMPDLWGSSDELRLRHVLSDGSLAPGWPTSGVLVASGDSNVFDALLVPDGAGGVILAWTAARGSSNSQLHLSHFDVNGTPVSGWPGANTPAWDIPGVQFQYALAPDGRGGAYIVWGDQRDSTDAVYAHHVLPSGVPDPAWPAWGRLLPTERGIAPTPYLHVDLAGGVVASWFDGLDSRAMRFDRWGLAGAHAQITSVVDHPGDQGGVLDVSFTRSWLDTMLTLPVAAYRVWREVPSRAAFARMSAGTRAVALHDAGGVLAPGALATTNAAGTTRYWEMYTAIAASAQPSYTVQVGTLADSVPGSAPRTAVMIEARAGDGVRAWVSAERSGASVDNLAPPAPSSVTGLYTAGSVSLHWRASGAADLARYTVHRGTSASFTPTAANLVATVTDTAWTAVVGAPYWYRVVAMDIHGNQSASIAVQPTGSLDVSDAAPGSFALEPPAPNPSRGETALRFTLAREGRASLVIHDAQGRAVRTLVRGVLGAGSHSLAWDGRDDTGRAAAPGLYFARFTSDGRTLTRRFAMVP